MSTDYFEAGLDNAISEISNRANEAAQAGRSFASSTRAAGVCAGREAAMLEALAVLYRVRDAARMLAAQQEQKEARSS